jgi:hypothetical protein
MNDETPCRWSDILGRWIDDDTEEIPYPTPDDDAAGYGTGFEKIVRCWEMGVEPYKALSISRGERS